MSYLMAISGKTGRPIATPIYFSRIPCMYIFKVKDHVVFYQKLIEGIRGTPCIHQSIRPLKVIPSCTGTLSA